MALYFFCLFFAPWYVDFPAHPPYDVFVKKILLYGNSIVMAGLAARLRDQVGVEVMAVPDVDPQGLRDHADLDTIIVDLSTVPLATLLALLNATPKLLLLGVDAIAGSLIMLSGRFYPVRSMEEVLPWILEPRLEGAAART